MKKFLLLFILTIGLIIGGKTMAKEVLTEKQQDIAIIASYTAVGNLTYLDTAINKGLDDGLTINEIKEILIQMYAYCGFPRSLNGLGTLLAVTDKRKEAGKKDVEGVAGTPLVGDKLEVGTKVQTDLVGQPVEGRLFDFAPAIDEFLKTHLFGDIFARGVLTHEDREVATIAALSAMEGVEPQLKAHIQMGRNTGLTNEQVEKIIQVTKKGGVFKLGEENKAYAKYFVGESYLNPLTSQGVHSANVTFEPKCRNDWHIHHNGGQILLVTDGRGWYQEWGKPAQELHRGDVVNIPAEVKHWHGAAKDSWFSHVAIAVPAENATTEWLEKVSDEDYSKLK